MKKFIVALVMVVSGGSVLAIAAPTATDKHVLFVQIGGDVYRLRYQRVESEKFPYRGRVLQRTPATDTPWPEIARVKAETESEVKERLGRVVKGLVAHGDWQKQ